MRHHHTGGQARALLLAAITGVLLAGCGGNGSAPAAQKPATTPPTTASTTAPTTAPTSTRAGACKYVSTAQAAELAASPVKPGVSQDLPSGPVSFSYCNYIFDPGNAPGVSVAVADLGSQGDSLFAQYRQSKASESEYQAVPGVGDEAFFAGENLYVRSGGTGLILYVGRANGSPRGQAGIPDEKKLADLVLSQL